MASALWQMLTSKRLREIALFLVGGSLAFAIDAGVLLGLGRLDILPPILARVPAILAAMVFAWLWHRRMTFSVDRPPSRGEFVRYASVSAVSAVLNYGIYVVLLVAGIGFTPFWALVVASLAAAVLSFVGYRSFAFGISARAK